MEYTSSDAGEYMWKLLYKINQSFLLKFTLLYQHCWANASRVHTLKWGTTSIGDDLLIAFVLSESAAQRLIIHRWSSISFHYAIMLKADWVGPTGKRTIWTFEWSPWICVGPKGVFACLLSVEPTLFAFSKMAQGKGIGGIIIQMLVSVPQTR